eukprot:6247669-Pyramimonas_sp.AAC.1
MVVAAGQPETLDEALDFMPGPALARDADLASPLGEPGLGRPAVLVELPADGEARWGPSEPS